MRTDQDHQYIETSCTLLFETIQLPVSYTRINDSQIHSFGIEAIESNPLFEHHSELVMLLKQQVQQPLHVPIIHTTNFGESFVIIPLLRNGDMEAIVLIGPSTVIPMNNEIINALLSEFGYGVTPVWISYLQQLPLYSTKRLNHIGILAFHLFNGIMLDLTDITEKYVQFEHQAESSNQAAIAISDRRELLEFRGVFEIEKQLLRSIRNGDKTAFYNMTLSVNHDGPGILSNYNQLRKIKNLGVYVTALATRAAIEGGLYPEVAYTVSDLHIERIEDLHEYNKVVSAIGAALIDFVDRVYESKRKHLSKSIATCQEYIFNHLYESIPLAVLSDLVGLHENYLSQLFKKETGVTITQFIQQEKVDEAKKLLELTSEPITAIATKLNFYDQNHLIKIFKRYTGLTPKKYRNKNKFDALSFSES